MDFQTVKMDSEFDNQVSEMKPYLLNLPLKSERQRCALWVKKLCEPLSSTTERKNRNQYSKLLLRMLKRGNLEGPFTSQPEPGPLKSLPSYMCVFLDETNSTNGYYQKDLNLSGFSSGEGKTTFHPDWLKDELPYQSQFDAYTGREENLSPFDTDGTNSRLRTFSLNQYMSDARKTKIGLKDDKDKTRIQEKEMEIKVKLMEAEFHEEKLNLQHKHDLALQKVLNRKNTEIDDLKRHYKGKEKENEEARRKLEKKIQSILKDNQAEREMKDQQIEDLNSMVEETRQSLQAEYETKFNEVMSNVEKEKYELQKLNTQNIQELLDDTNKRLTNMEDEYNSQAQATKVVISELEHHVSLLTQETETMANNKQLLLAENQQLKCETNRSNAEIKLLTKKSDELRHELTTVREDLSTTIKNLQNKHEASVEYLKQEQKVSATRSQETLRDLEDQVQALKHALQDSDQQRTRELREKDSLHQQDVMSLQHLHEKQIHNVRAEWDQDRAQQNRTVKSLEDTLRDKDDQIVKLTMTQKQCMADAENAIDTYKKQVSEAQQKVYSDMRSQLEKLEADLEQSKLTREKLQHEYEKQIEEMKERHNDEIVEYRTSLERENGLTSQRYASERDKLMKNYEEQLSNSEARLRENLEQQERLAEDRRSQHQEVVMGLEQQIRDLREELVSSNALRRQQLVELGLLREEERQKASRDHDIAVAKLEAEIDRQQMEFHQQNAAEIDKLNQKMKAKMQQIEEEYRQRLERAHERLLDAQNKESSLRESMIQNKNDAEEQILQLRAKLEEEANSTKSELHSQLLTSQAELEQMKDELRQQERHYQQVEFNLKNEMSRIRLENEERIKGLIPKSLKADLEDTISCLRSQIKSLQQRIEILQEEMEADKAYAASSLHSPIRLSSH